MSTPYLLYIAAVLVASFAQILLKTSADRKQDGFIKEYTNPYVLTGYLIMLLSAALAMSAFKNNLSFKFTPALESLSYLFVPLLSALIFKEKISNNKKAGIIIIIIGIAIFNI